jgi:hypothetical protein
MELCCICFDQVCTIEVNPCGHQMCAHCTLALCCLKKPDPATGCTTGPLCPFCRGAILQLTVAKINTSSDTEVESTPITKPRRSRKSNFSEGSSSFKSLSAIGSFGRIAGRNSGKIDAEKQWGIFKSWWLLVVSLLIMTYEWWFYTYCGIGIATYCSILFEFNFSHCSNDRTIGKIVQDNSGTIFLYGLFESL